MLGQNPGTLPIVIGETTLIPPVVDGHLSHVNHGCNLANFSNECQHFFKISPIPPSFAEKKTQKMRRKNPSQTRGIGHQAQHGHGDVDEKSDASLGGHWGCTATPLPGGHGLGGG